MNAGKMEQIIITDAHENNLKHINLEIPLISFNCITGCSGSGKSSLIFDTIYAESQRAFLEGMAGSNFNQKLMDKPKVGKINNLRAALNVSQNYYNVNPRSTIGTVTEISGLIRSIFAIANSSEKITINENIFSYNNPESFCQHCSGLGYENIISESLLIPDRSKSLLQGGIIYFKGSTSSKEQRYLQALCTHYDIDINKSINQLTSEEINILLYADDNVETKISYRLGKKRKQHKVLLQGAITAIKSRLDSKILQDQPSPYSQYIKRIPCTVCNGAKLSDNILKYKFSGLNYYEVENMEISSLRTWLTNVHDSKVSPEKMKIIYDIIETLLIKLDYIIQLKIGYLCLNRPIPTLSSGERQRIRISRQLSCPLKDLIYIFDEPCKGLHYKDIDSLINVSKELVRRGNTVIAIDHNKRYIYSSDCIIELGPAGGPKGGYIIDKYKGNINYRYKLLFKNPCIVNDYISIKNINFRNLINQSVKFPIGAITCISGVSGSGKSSLIQAIVKYILENKKNDCPDNISLQNIKHIYQVDQSPIGKSSRSTIASYLGIFDDIRILFSETEDARKMNITPSMFSINVVGGRCETCQGTGVQKIELNYLPDSFITCPVCCGKRYHDSILSIKYKNKTIADILESPVSDVMDTFKDNPQIYRHLSVMDNLGISYLKLGQMSMHLSGGEAQRIKLAKALITPNNCHNIYILDEPTSGLNDDDINKLMRIISKMQEKGETIIMVEHNCEIIARIADYIIDLGVVGGKKGGKIVAQGLPEYVFSHHSSSLYDIYTE